MSDVLHILAINAKTEVRHTHLTRARGEAPELPPLTEWLGAEVDTDEVELFPVKDLGEMALSDYVTMAFAPEAIPPQALRRMNALKGHVLLVPERALSEEPAPGKEATLIASLPLARADHGGTLPKAEITPPPRPAPAPTEAPRRRGSATWVIGIVVLLALILAVALR
jgi:hypothetical protein